MDQFKWMEQGARSCYMLNGIVQRLRKNWFLLGVVCVITCAKLYPWIGAKGGKRFDVK